MSRINCGTGKMHCAVFSMISNKAILIKNIYYMLTYAFQVLKQSNYDEIASEEFENIHDLFAAILAKGIARQLKQGLYREYVTERDNLSVMRGKLEFQGTMNNKLQRRQMLSCEYDELSENNIFNQILKTTSTILIQQPTVSVNHKTALKKSMLFFGNVDRKEPTCFQWNRLRFEKNNQSYRLLLNICFFVLEGLLLTTEKGEYKMASFLDEQHMSRLYEKFILEYYRYHYPELRPAASQVAWNLDDGTDDFLPVMQTDITLGGAASGGIILIIDAKYYTRTMQVQGQYDSRTLHSNNLYQIFTYVKNKDVGNTGKVAGMLLYAKPDEAITPDCDFRMSGNKISVKTLDLNIAFADIAAQLDQIALTYFSDHTESAT